MDWFWRESFVFGRLVFYFSELWLGGAFVLVGAMIRAVEDIGYQDLIKVTLRRGVSSSYILDLAESGP